MNACAPPGVGTIGEGEAERLPRAAHTRAKRGKEMRVQFLLYLVYLITLSDLMAKKWKMSGKEMENWKGEMEIKWM